MLEGYNTYDGDQWVSFFNEPFTASRAWNIQVSFLAIQSMPSLTRSLDCTRTVKNSPWSKATRTDRVRGQDSALIIRHSQGVSSYDVHLKPV